MKAMIFAAGLGTRLKPWTDHHPKALAIVNGKSLLQRNIEYLQQHNIKNVVVNVHHFANQIIDQIKNNNGWGSTISISDESDEVLETGGGLLKAAHYLSDEGPFVVMNADILTDLNLQAMQDFHAQHKPLATLATTHRSTSRYFLFDQDERLCGWKNIKTGDERIVMPATSISAAAFSGIHIIDPVIFNLIIQGGKFSMVDVYLSLASSNIIRRFDHSDGKLIDVGKPDALAKAEELFI